MLLVIAASSRRAPTSKHLPRRSRTARLRIYRVSVVRFLHALKNVADGLGVPLPPAGRRDTTGVQGVRNAPQCSRARLLCLSNDGRTFAAYLSASAFTASTAPLRATWSVGLPRETPRAFAAARACRVRVLINARSFSARAAKRCSTNGSTSGPSSATTNGTLCAISPHEMDVAAKTVQFRDNYLAPLFPCGCQSRFQLGPAIQRVRAFAGLHLTPPHTSKRIECDQFGELPIGPWPPMDDLSSQIERWSVDVTERRTTALMVSVR